MFQQYIAVGDSMSIDQYPAMDAKRTEDGARVDIGAAALLHHNDDRLFPEFAGNDLPAMFSGIKFVSKAFDGATCDDFLTTTAQSALGELSHGRALVTLSIGGNDLLDAHRRSARGDRQTLMTRCTEAQSNYDRVVSTIRDTLPNCVLVLTTIYDPTDGTGVLPTTSPLYDSTFPIDLLLEFNSFIRGCASSRDILVADVHKHFVGHGANCGSADQFWFWPPSPIEPSHRGASEIRRVWLDTIKAYVALG